MCSLSTTHNNPCTVCISWSRLFCRPSVSSMSNEKGPSWSLDCRLYFSFFTFQSIMHSLDYKYTYTIYRGGRRILQCTEAGSHSISQLVAEGSRSSSSLLLVKGGEGVVRQSRSWRWQARIAESKEQETVLTPDRSTLIHCLHFPVRCLLS